MDTPRQGHTATTLETGEVLVTGGETSPGVYLNSAQRFDPALHNWSSTGGMGASRTQQTATLLLDGRVLITGGITKSGPIFSTAATAEVYERDGDTWSSAGAMSDARAGHTATRLLDGRVLVAGGDDEGGPLDSVDIYAPLMNDWIAAAPMIEARTHAAASLLPDGRVLMAGGGGFGFSDTVEIYDPQTNTWTSAPDMHHVRRGLSATTLADGRVLVAAGDDATPATSEIYDPVLNNWLTTGLMHPQRGLHAAALLGDSGVLVVGGSDVADAPSEAAEVYAAALPDDNDGVLAGIDNCPFVANPSQANADAAPVVTAGAPADASRPRSDGFGDACDSDDDGDGLSDLAESLLDLAPYAAGCAGATSASVPFLVDSDSDLTVDGAECVLGTDPTDTNSKPSPVQPGDPDLDGLPTSLEQLIGSNPNNADTDGDGITDGIEYRGYATFPTLADSDGDGCTDGAEIASVDGSSAVNSLDLVLVAQRFLRTDQPVHDVNKDGTVNSLDLQLVARNFDPGGCP
jgi:hypothetical protein